MGVGATLPAARVGELGHLPAGAVVQHLDRVDAAVADLTIEVEGVRHPGRSHVAIDLDEEPSTLHILLNHLQRPLSPAAFHHLLLTTPPLLRHHFLPGLLAQLVS